ncbi:MAG: hypothetical protein BM557_03110 [Flavobacterium sp. MedPE-SWcel]|uniref:ComEC/Rec2 family competence protein n=1 Tax=uncultured Flavobacterium sp. TaxID=165435 RepID=UPI000915A1EA|nr:ComEC/Rec2 family competence protein [uncultured Flavobacterium sp.]OIQ21796.1 MAG: hypothetical protein BM557_03110 [Flavobacterium sp. MedPE-SWcel]
MKILKYPIIPITTTLAIGIAVGAYSNLPLFTTYIATGVSFLLFVTSYWLSAKTFVQKPYFSISTLLLAFFTGLLTFSLHHPPNSPTHYSNVLTAGEAPLIKGYIAERIKPNDFNEKYYLKVQSVNKKPATGKILITVPIKSHPLLFLAGDVIIIHDTPKPITKTLNPYQFDYAAYMEKQNIFHQVKLKKNYITAGQVKNFDYYIDSFRRELIYSFDNHNYSPRVMNVVKALLLGQRQDIDKNIKANYIDAGVMHILAISGLHIAILFYMISLILKPLNRFNKKGKLIQLLATLAFLWFFAIIAGLSASIVRAVVMFSFVSIGLYFNRNANTFNSIAVSMLVLILVKPAFLFDVGFQLSYAAVFSIVWLQPLYQKIKVSKYKAVNYFIDIIVISLVAQLGVLPLSLYYFNQFPLLFPIANIVVIPIATLVLILGIITLIFNFIYNEFALLLGEVLEFLIWSMNSFIQWIASFKDLVIKDISFSLLLTISLYAIIISGVLWSFKKEYKRIVITLCAVLLFQFIYIATKWQANNSEELIIFNNWNNSLIAARKQNTITFYSNDSLVTESYNAKAYIKGSFSDSINTTSLQNTLWFKQHKILLLDKKGIYSKTMQPDIVLLTKSSKVNLEQLLQEVKPKIVVADATNYKTFIKRWEIICEEQKIPFHATAEKGFYIIK